MRIAPFAKVALGLGSSAAGVPVALHLQSQTENISKSSGISQISINKCDSQNHQEGETINFGDSSIKTACGSVEKDEGNTNSELTEELKYNQLFQNMGNNQNGSGSSGNDYGKTHCSNSQGTFKSQGEGSESLGLCESSNSPNQWLMVKNDSNTTSITVCSGECFGKQTSYQGKTLDSSQKTGNWKTIQFRRIS